MPTFTYPGVYIEELSSGVHSITGVATSIAAFIGWAPQGPTEQATLIESWADYQALFGGLDARSKLGYSVNQFFANGGTQAYIVRLVWEDSLVAAPGTNPTPSATAVAAGVGYATAAISASLGAIVVAVDSPERWHASVAKPIHRTRQSSAYPVRRDPSIYRDRQIFRWHR